MDRHQIVPYDIFDIPCVAAAVETVEHADDAEPSVLGFARGNLCATIGRGEGIIDVGAALCLLLEAGGEFRYLSGPPVDIAAYVEGNDLPPKGDRDFLLYGPPRLLGYLQELLRPL